MKLTIKIPGLLCVGMISLFAITGCDSKNDGPDQNVPVLTTQEAMLITNNSAFSGGTITDDAGSDIIARGVCWSKQSSPTTSDDKTNDGTGTGSFASSIAGLSSNTPYYVRAYATNANGTGYGNQVTFTTSSTVKYLRGTVDGVLFQANTITAAITGGMLGISGMSGSNNMILWLPEDFTLGTHTMIMMGDYHAQYLRGGSVIFNTDSGTMEVLEYDTNSRHLKGSFSFEGLQAGGSERITVTGGEFEIDL